MNCPACQGKCLRFIFQKEGLELNRCRCCGLVQVDNADDKFDAKHYEYYKDRLGCARESRYNPITTKRYVDLLKRLEKYRKNNSLLDIGCGEGQLLSVARDLGWQIKGIELGPYAVEVCRKFGINAECVDLLESGMQPGSYDIITIFEVLEHLVRPKQYLDKANFLLRRGGALIITTPNFDCLTRRILARDWSLIHKEHLFYYTPRSLKRIISNAGFKIIDFKVKTITLPEIWAFLMSRDRDKMHVYNKAIRQAAETNIVLSCLKSLANGFLNATALGETIECICQKK